MAELKTTVILVMSRMMSSDASAISGHPVSIFRKEARHFPFFRFVRPANFSDSVDFGANDRKDRPTHRATTNPVRSSYRTTGWEPTALMVRIFVIPVSIVNFYATETFGAVDKLAKD